MLEIGLLALIVGLVALCFAAVRRPLSEGLAGPTGYWTWACAAIFASGFCTLFASDYAWSLPIGYALGTAYPALLLSGALAYAGRRVPSWLPVLGFLVGFTRGLLALRLSPELNATAHDSRPRTESKLDQTTGTVDATPS